MSRKVKMDTPIHEEKMEPIVVRPIQVPKIPLSWAQMVSIKPESKGFSSRKSRKPLRGKPTSVPNTTRYRHPSRSNKTYSLPTTPRQRADSWRRPPSFDWKTSHKFHSRNRSNSTLTRCVSLPSYSHRDSEKIPYSRRSLGSRRGYRSVPNSSRKKPSNGIKTSARFGVCGVCPTKTLTNGEFWEKLEMLAEKYKKQEMSWEGLREQICFLFDLVYVRQKADQKYKERNALSKGRFDAKQDAKGTKPSVANRQVNVMEGMEQKLIKAIPDALDEKGGAKFVRLNGKDYYPYKDVKVKHKDGKEILDVRLGYTTLDIDGEERKTISYAAATREFSEETGTKKEKVKKAKIIGRVCFDFLYTTIMYVLFFSGESRLPEKFTDFDRKEIVSVHCRPLIKFTPDFLDKTNFNSTSRLLGALKDILARWILKMYNVKEY